MYPKPTGENMNAQQDEADFRKAIRERTDLAAGPENWRAVSVVIEYIDGVTGIVTIPNPRIKSGAA